MKTTLLLLLTGLMLHGSVNAQNALLFDGIDDYVQSPNPGPTGSASRTVEAWVKLTALSPTQQVIVTWGDMAVSNRFTLNIINGIPRIEVGGSGISGFSSLPLNTWQHIAATFVNSPQQVLLYINGQLINSGLFTVPVTTSSVDGIIIGRRNDAINYFQGYIDEVRVWSTVRTQAQIQQNLNKEFCGPVPGLVSYFNFNQGVAGGVNTTVTTLPDLSGNNNNGILNNFQLAGLNSNWVTGQTLSGNSASQISASACSSYTSPSGQYVYTTSGTYTDTIANVLGCDSVITINLNIAPVDTSVTQIADTLTASATAFVTYQWLNCTNQFAVIPGATSQSFVPTVNGSYAVVVSNGICIDTSSCYDVINLGLLDPQQALPLNVYPNPSSDIFFADLSMLSGTAILQVFDVTGKLLHRRTLELPVSDPVQLSGFRSGMYQVKVTNGSRLYSSRIIVR